MSLFICSKCGCVENTATSDYWSVIHKLFEIEYENDLIEYKYQPLCSECGRLIFDKTGNNPKMVKGEWHNRFEKQKATQEQIDKMNKNNRIIMF